MTATSNATTITNAAALRQRAYTIASDVYAMANPSADDHARAAAAWNDCYAAEWAEREARRAALMAPKFRA